MTRLSAAMVRCLGLVPDPPGWEMPFTRRQQVTLYCLERRGLVERHPTYQTAYTRTPFGRETAERLEKGKTT